MRDDIEAVAEGESALRAGEWERARQAFMPAAEAGTPAALEGLGMAAWWMDDADALFAAWEAAYRGYLDDLDEFGAARVAAILGTSSVLFRGEWAVGQGWFARAHRLIDDRPDAPEHVRLCICEGLMALTVSQDPATSVDLGRRGVAVARELGSRSLELQSLALEGVSLVRLGAVSEGMQLLDEATAGALAGEIQELDAVWLTCCFLLWGCEHVRDYDRAGQWCERMTEFAQRWQMAFAFAVCRTHYATVLTWKGSWEEAERELEAAGAVMLAGRQASAGEAWARLGELRRRQGRHEEARALFERAPFTPLAHIGAAALLLDEGDGTAAIDRAARFLRSVHAVDVVTRSAALEVLVRAAAAVGRLDDATTWLQQLDSCAERLAASPVRAGAAWCRGVCLLASGDVEGAVTQLERAALLYDQSGGVFEAAVVRRDLSRALERCGDAVGAARARHDADIVLRDLGVREAGGGRTRSDALGSLTNREVEVVRLIAEGRSNRAIAATLTVSEHTVKRHVANILTKTGLPTRAAVAALATREL